MIEPGEGAADASSVGAKVRAKSPPNWAWRSISLTAVSALIFLLVREMFTRGLLIGSDFFGDFSVAKNGLQIYLSRWNPGGLGSESSQPAILPLQSIFLQLGTPPLVFEAVTFVALLMIGGLSIQLLIEPYLRVKYASLLAPFLYLASPLLFIEVFNGLADIALYSLLPLLVLLAFRIERSPNLLSSLLFAGALATCLIFVPYAILYVVPPLLVLLATRVAFSANLTRALKVGFWVLVGFVVAILANAPFYIGNLTYFTTGSSSNGLLPSETNALRIIGISYSWSSPVHIFSLLGGGLFIRYGTLFSPIAEALLVGLAAFALLSAITLGRSVAPWFRIGLLLLFVTSFAWVWLTYLGLTDGAYSAIPLLLVFNYPIELYLYICLAICLLATFVVDDLLSILLAKSRGLFPCKVSKSVPVHHRRVYGRIHSASGPLAVAASVAFLVVVSGVSGGFYLAQGDFDVFNAPSAYGFPPEWGATEPPSYDAMYTFLENHGGVLATRALILPYPGPNGGTSFEGFSYNLFDQQEPGTGISPLFQQPNVLAYSYDVMSYFLENRTNDIGVLLGIASVKYVLVDLTANFSGPPRWISGSLVGSPGAFVSLLNAQTDLMSVFNSSLFDAYLNLDYQPYVQAYDGVTAVVEGVPSVPQNRTAFSWPATLSSWSAPNPPDRIENYSTLSNGYFVIASNDAGSMRIQFNTSSDSIIATSDGWGNDGIYIVGSAVRVESPYYTLVYDSFASGASSGCNYLNVNGLDAAGNILWVVPSYTTGTTVGDRTTVPVSVFAENSATAYLTVTIALPCLFGPGAQTSFTVENLSIEANQIPPPAVAVSPLLVRNLPSNDSIRSTATTPFNQVANEGGFATLESSHVLRTLCLMVCIGTNESIDEELILAYEGLNVSAGSYRDALDPGSMSGAVLDLSGNTTSTVVLGNHPFSSVSIRASGNGSMQISTDRGPIVSFPIPSKNLSWQTVTLGQTLNITSATVSSSGNVECDALLFAMGDLNGSQGALAEPSLTAQSLTEYTGTAPNGSTILVLAQGFNPGWILSYGTAVAPALPAFGWSIFFAPAPAAVGPFPFKIAFAPQTTQTALVTIQSATIAFVVAEVLIGFLAPTLYRRQWDWVGRRFSNLFRHRPTMRRQ